MNMHKQVVLEFLEFMIQYLAPAVGVDSRAKV